MSFWDKKKSIADEAMDGYVLEDAIIKTVDLMLILRKISEGEHCYTVGLIRL